MLFKDDLSLARWTIIFLTTRGGCYISVSYTHLSTAAITGGSSGSHYAATKGAIIPFSKALARDYASSKITVNVVAPGKIETDLFHATITPEAVSYTHLDVYKRQVGNSYFP